MPLICSIKIPVFIICNHPFNVTLLMLFSELTHESPFEFPRSIII